MFTVRPPHLMPNTRKNSLIFNFLTIYIPPPNQSYGVVLSTPFLYMALSNTLPWIQKTIKVTLNFLAKYIRNKQVNNGKVNDLGDFNGMGDTIWNFLSSVYEAK